MIRIVFWALSMGSFDSDFSRHVHEHPFQDHQLLGGRRIPGADDVCSDQPFSRRDLFCIYRWGEDFCGAEPTGVRVGFDIKIAKHHSRDEETRVRVILRDGERRNALHRNAGKRIIHFDDLLLLLLLLEEHDIVIDEH
jgi:hypothetical protein